MALLCKILKQLLGEKKKLKTYGKAKMVQKMLFYLFLYFLFFGIGGGGGGNVVGKWGVG